MLLSQAQVAIAEGNISLSVEVNVSGEVEGIHFEKELTEGAFYYKGIQLNR